MSGRASLRDLRAGERQLRDEPLAIVGMDCCLPGAAHLEEFETLLFESRSGISELAPELLQPELYFDSRRGQPGKTYTRLGGFVPPRAVDLATIGIDAETAAQFDPVHLRFCEVAARAWKRAGFSPRDSNSKRAGVFIGHSGATENGGKLNLATLIDEGLDFLLDVEEFRRLPESAQSRVIGDVAERVRHCRPRRSRERLLKYEGYSAAALCAQVLGFEGPRLICDAACASSLFAMQQAINSLRMGRIDAAIVGGATTNGVDNLILFSQSQACSATGSCPFDQAASGLISSEGYAAVVIVPISIASELQLDVLGVIEGLGTSSDGRGKSLWAPRAEGQRLAIERAYPPGETLAIDYLEAHATSTQLGDATELKAIHSLLSEGNTKTNDAPLLIGSLKSNLGHTLETAGVAGLIKILLAMKRERIPESLNFQTPNTSFDWSSGTIQVVGNQQPWRKRLRSPSAQQKKRAAVSAFGIGGLNAHLFVEEGTSADKQKAEHFSQRNLKTQKFCDEPIAIVGRGAILPGAHNISRFRDLLQQGHSVIGPPPADRWRPGIGLNVSVPTSQGGYIRDYQFDSQAYRIPPKQVKQANPLQMMLLDAVTQAIGEVDQGQWNVNRQKAGVVIGTIFSGDFGSQLQLGLRLPEIQRELRQALASTGVSESDIETILRKYRDVVLQARPALLDETGSFTASTLASRIAKTFDLMGGASAIDVDDASGLAALSHAIDQLRSGAWELAICGGAERSMDLSKFELLHLTGRLVSSGRPEEIPDDCSRILPGEGAVVFLLERLSTAKAAGHTVYGLIDDVQAASQLPDQKSPDASLARLIGYLTGAQSLVELLKATCNWELHQNGNRHQIQPVRITSRTEDGITYQASCRPDGAPAASIGTRTLTGTPLEAGSYQNQDAREPRGATSPVEARRAEFHSISELDGPPGYRSMSPVMNFDIKSRSSHPLTFRFEGETPDHLARELRSVLQAPERTFHQPQPEFSSQSACRLLVLAETIQELTERVSSVLRNWERGRRCGVFETDRAILWQVSSRPVRTAWMFPGQGSQYTGGPAALKESSTFTARLQEIDQELIRLGREPLSPHLDDSASPPVMDIWWNQLWVLGNSLSLTAELQQHGWKPDLVLGHSFGEYSALAACGSLTLAQVLRMVKSRADAVAMTVRNPGQLISIRATPQTVENIIREAALPATITHYNGPQQTVVATDHAHVETIRKAFLAVNLASIQLPVPVAYHTDRLQAAEELLAQAFGQEKFLPPNCGLISTSSARYLAEPADLREALVKHLTLPVLFVPTIERLLADDVQLLLEVGPNQVLSRLANEIAGERALCLSLDVPGRTFAERLALVRGAMEITSTGNAAPVCRVETETSRVEPVSPMTAAPVRSTSASDDVEIVDFHRVRKKEVPAAESPRPLHTTTSEQTLEPALEAVSENRMATDQVSSESRSRPSLEEVRNFLLTVVVDLTGYSPDVIDFDADLEADLGVDSIKKAQVIGELAECFELSVAPSGLTMSDLNTLNDIAAIGVEYGTSKFEKAGTNGKLPHAVSASQQVPAVSGSHEPVSSEADAVSSTGTAIDLDSIERFLIDLVVDQTGYSPDVVDLDADMEGDLGIDSIKQAQLLGEVQQQFDLQAVTAQQGTLTSFPTLRSILNFLAGHLTENGSAAFRLTLPQDSATDENGAYRNGQSHNIESHSTNGTSGTNGSYPAAPPSQKPASPFSTADEETLVPPKTIGVEPSLQISSDVQALFELSDSNSPDDWERGFARGQTHREQVQAALRTVIDRGWHLPAGETSSIKPSRELAGLAAGAGVTLSTVVHAHALFQNNGATSDATSTLELPTRLNSNIAESSATAATDTGVGTSPESAPLKPDQSMRFALRMVAAPQRQGMPTEPQLTGPALVIGEEQNPFAIEIRNRFRQQGQECYILGTKTSLQEIEAELEQLWSRELTPHLFIVTSHDSAAMQRIDVSHWKTRRFAAVEAPYRVCQLWMQKMIDAGRMDGASVVAVLNLGGDFGFSGESCLSPEGGLGGLVKAMLIEAWMRGYRATPMKLIDVSPETLPREAVEGIWRELAVPSYDMEVAWRNGRRFAVQPVHQPLPKLSERTQERRSRLRSGGVWVVTGGARGITSVVVRELAQRHNLKLHLLGTAPAPQVDPQLRERAAKNRLQVRREVMAEAARRNQNGMEAWRNVEKALEIDASLRLCAEAGVKATYHSCDVSDFEALSGTLERIRQQDGPIDGVIHGAGIGQDARFDRKRPDKVDQCLRAKIDGCINLMEATRKDPLQSFVAFGSISGRFGANGHTDYSFANDTLAKLVDRYRRERPEVASVTFHWHAWGDIGMATKPETKLALEMINLEFMPAREGLAHFLTELELGGNEPEVLITDRAYYRKFFPVDRNVSSTDADCFPLLDPEGDLSSPYEGPFFIELNPERERFLSQHLVQGKPTLPFVVALELMAEASRAVTGQRQIIEARDVEALQAIKWSSPASMTIRVATQPKLEGVECALIADVRRRDGRIVAQDRTYFRGTLTTGSQTPLTSVSLPDLETLPWIPIEYLEPDAPIYHGPDLQCLQAIALDGDVAYGKISASSTVQLGGGHRPTNGWSIHCAAMDACLYAAALFAGRKYGRASLPVRFDRIRFGRLPDPGEPCTVVVRLVNEEASGLTLALQLIGHNSETLLVVDGYQIGWLR